MSYVDVEYGSGGGADYSEFTCMAMRFRAKYGSHSYIAYFSPTLTIYPERQSTYPSHPDLTSDYTFFTCSAETIGSSDKYTFTVIKKCTVYLDGVKHVYDVGDTFDITVTTTEHIFTLLAMG